MLTKKLVRNKIYEQEGIQVVPGIVDKYLKILISLSLLYDFI